MMEGVVPQDYDALCRKWSDDDEAVSGWRELRLALGNRPGWWFLDPRALTGYDGGPLWCFGDQADASLCLSPVETGFGLYVADTDEEMTFDEVTAVVEWLDRDEAKHEALSPVLDQLLSGDFGHSTDSRRRN